MLIEDRRNSMLGLPGIALRTGNTLASIHIPPPPWQVIIKCNHQKIHIMVAFGYIFKNERISIPYAL